MGNHVTKGKKILEKKKLKMISDKKWGGRACGRRLKGLAGLAAFNPL